MSNSRTQTEPMRLKASARYRLNRRKRQRLLFGFVYAVLMLASVVEIAKFATERLQQAVANGEAQSGNVNDVRVGSIVLQTDKEQCEIAKFDNYTGRTIDNTKRCEKIDVRDPRGVPVPTATIHRLDSISKSFSGGER